MKPWEEIPTPNLKFTPSMSYRNLNAKMKASMSIDLVRVGKIPSHHKDLSITTYSCGNAKTKAENLTI